MAFEAVSQLHAAVKYDGVTPAIIARTGIASVVRTGVGTYQVNLTSPIAANGASVSHAAEGATDFLLSVTRVTATQYLVRVEDGDGPIDQIVNVSWYALTNRG